MDNVTHTLVGLIIGEPVAAHATHAVPRERGLPVQTRRTALLSVALLGSNSPDLDLLVSFRGSSTGRLLFALAVVGAVVLGLATGLMSGLSCFALAVGFLLLAASGSRLSASRASRLSVVLALAVTCAFALAGREAAQRAQGLAQAGFPGERLRDCEASAAHRDSRSGRRTRDRGRSMARRTSARGSLFKEVVAADCQAAAFMLFARAPFIARPHSSTVLGDLRFDRGRERGSFEVPLAGKQVPDSAGELLTCRRAAPWVAPRADLLGPAGR